MLEVLRRSPVLRVEGNKTVTLKNVRPPAKSLLLNAEAIVDATAPGQNATLEDAVREAAEKSGDMLPLSQKSVAFVFGPENAAVSPRLVDGAAREAHLKGYSHLYVIGFQIDPHARTLIDKNAEMGGIPTTYVQATHDLMMGDLLKNMRSSQIFSVCGMPEIKLKRLKTKGKDGSLQYEVKLLGLDVFDPSTMETEHRSGDDVPAWFLDSNYNGRCEEDARSVGIGLGRNGAGWRSSHICQLRQIWATCAPVPAPLPTLPTMRKGPSSPVALLVDANMPD